MPTVTLTVTCECGRVIGTYVNAIEEKYPFWCEDCDEYKRTDRYPWKLEAIVDDGLPLTIDASRLIGMIVAACQTRGVPERASLWLLNQLIGVVADMTGAPEGEMPKWLQQLSDATRAQLAACPPGVLQAPQ